MDHPKTLLNMSPATRTGYDYWLGRQNRSVLVTIRVTPQERAAIRAAAESENLKVSKYIRAAIAVRARDGYCNAHQHPDGEDAS